MTNTAKKITILSANLNFYMSNKVQKKTSEKIVEMLLSEEQNPKPTFILLQEVGNRVIYKVEKDEIEEDYSVNIKQIENELFNEGYGVIRPKQYGKEKDANNPVNTRLFYLKKSVEFIEELQPLGLGIEEDFYNRQCAGIFTINNQTISVYSLHFPWTMERDAFWKKYIEIAKSNKYNHLILAGDFNESLINVTTELSDKITQMKNHMKDASQKLPTWKDKQLDHIFITPNTKIENYSTLDNDFSDHKALQVTIIV